VTYEIAEMEPDGDVLVLRTTTGETLKIPNTPLNQWHFKPGSLVRQDAEKPHPASIHAEAVA
jgi:hypothetical protein